MKLARIVASGFGSGFFPVAPGTAGSVVAVICGSGLMQGPDWVLAVFAVLAVVAGFWAVGAAHVQGDPGWFVMDEFAGQWIGMLGLARPSIFGLLVAFLVFRLLDVTKLGPIGWADSQPGVWGVMADDIIAGVLTAGVVWGLRVLLPQAF